jgi:hypothetical protein
MGRRRASSQSEYGQRDTSAQRNERWRKWRKSAGREQDNLDVKAWRGLKLMLPLKKERMHVDRNGKRNAKFPGSKEAVEVVLCE